MSIRIDPLPRTKKFYEDFIASYSSPATQRRVMTREINAHKKFIEAISEALSRPGNDKGWYLGERYNTYHLHHYQKEVELMQSLKDAIK